MKAIAALSLIVAMTGFSSSACAANANPMSQSYNARNIGMAQTQRADVRKNARQQVTTPQRTKQTQ